MVVVGRGALRQLADGRLADKLTQADALGARCLSENQFLRALGLLPPAPPEAGALALDELPARTGLSPEVVDLLVLFDVVQPRDRQCSFRELVAAREVARLLADGLPLSEILESAGRLAQPGGADHPLTRLKLISDEAGRLARRIGDHIAELDGQLRLPLANPGNPSADELFEAAEEAEQAGDLVGAASLYRRCVDLDRTDPIALFNLANVVRELGRPGEAKLILQRALDLDPMFADAWYNLAAILKAEGQNQAARQCLERAVAADPDYGDPLYNLAQLHFEAGDLQQAGELWRRYLRIDPDSEWSRKARQGLRLCRQQGQGSN
jgi:tetratricopeptide (TPR) repeat protein